LRTDMRLTTIIPWANRSELEQTLRHNAPIFAEMDSDVLVANCGGDPERLRVILADCGVSCFRTIEIPVQRFNRSLALNIGVHCAAPGVVFLLDADVLLRGSLRKYVDICASERCFAFFQATDTPPLQPDFVPPPGSFLKTIISTSFMSFVWADGTTTRIERNRWESATCRRSIPGMTIINREHLITVGGFRSSFVGWGWEDMDLQLRLRRIGLESIDVIEDVLHLAHGDEKRDLLDGETRQGAGMQNAKRAIEHFSKGEFQGTYETDLKLWQSLAPQRSMIESPAG
jgi:hypothetical protein